MTETPVLLLVFNRPQHTKQVLEAIACASPKRLYVSCDGPRNESDASKINLVWALVDQLVQWPCTIVKREVAENAGCKQSVVNGITWFFEHEEEGIILEDDTVPHPSFFRFCSELLKVYRHTNEIMHISGSTTPVPASYVSSTYFFTRYPGIWGWATWRRAWSKYDIHMDDLKDLTNNLQLKSDLGKKTVERWKKKLDYVQETSLDTWDYQWLHTLFVHDGLAIRPSKNLVTNIGFGEDATHTHSSSSPWASMPVYEFEHIKHPACMQSIPELDEFLSINEFGLRNSSMHERIEKLKSILLRIPLVRYFHTHTKKLAYTHSKYT